MRHRSQLLPAAVGSVLATAVALTPVYTRQAWFWPSVLAVGVAFALGALTRRLDVPTVLSPAVSLLGLGVLVGLLFYPETTAAGIPTAGTLEAVGTALREAGQDIQRLSAPVDLTEALTLLTTGGVYLVAMVVDLMVFRSHKPAMAGLPLLALYLVPASLAPKGASVLPFIAAAAGYIWLLVAEGRDRARGWGRRLVGIGLVEDLTDLSPVARVGRRLGAAAVVVAIVVPVFVPSLGDGFVGSGRGLFGSGDGPSSATVVNPIVELQPQLRDDKRVVLMRVETEHPEYLRLTALDRFDGEIWAPSEQRAEDEDARVGKTKQRVPLPPQLQDPALPRTAATYDIAVEGLDVSWLPAPYAVEWIKIKSKKWLYELESRSIFSSRATSRRTRYTAGSLLVNPPREFLEGDFNAALEEDMLRYLDVPANPPKIVTDELTKLRAKADTPYELAVALQRWFTTDGGFTYSLDVQQGNSTDHLANFLDRKTGYCEQFAATMAYMARLAGIPARVVIGFTPGTKQADGSFVVTNKEAHAWPELWFPRAGWLRFEPTPSGATTAPGYSIATQPGTAPSPGGSPTPSASAEPSSGPSASASPVDPDRRLEDPLQDPAGGSGSGGGPPLWLVAAVLVLMAVLVAPFAAAAATRSRRWQQSSSDATRAHAAWDAVADAAEDVGLPLRASDSPRSAAARLVTSASLEGPPAEALLSLAAVEERARYARQAPAAAELESRARAVRAALFATLPGRRRLRAMVFPRSTLRRARERVVLTIDLLDRRQAAMWAGLRRLASFRGARP